MKKFSILLITLLIFFCQISFAKQNDSKLDKEIGQMIIVGFDGNDINSKGFKKVLKDINSGKIGGVILFNKNIKSKESLIEMNEKMLSSSVITPFIAIDNEGGKVQRHDFFYTSSAKEVSTMTEKEAGIAYNSMAKNLKELKINLNFAPCVDLTINKNSIINKKERSYGDNPEIVTKYASIFIDEHSKNKIITSIKHFPGHGSVKGDTHKGFVDATKVFKQEELEPYKNLKNKDKTMVMVSHIYNSNFDKVYPASLSKNTVTTLLKENIGFSGVIISDDYDMGAIRDKYSLEDIVTTSINAGVDILLFSNNLKYKDENLSEKIHKIIKKEIKKGNIKEANIDESYRKIMALKQEL